MKPIDIRNPQGAVFSDDGLYRYALWRRWSMVRPLMMFIGLNPSKASAVVSDPTVTRMLTRANTLGYGGLFVGNLFALVSTDPKELLKDGDKVGEHTDYYLIEMIKLSSRVMCGWGSFPAAERRAETVIKMIPEPYCLGINSGGQPKHPLYIGYDVQMIKFKESKNG